MHLEWIHLSNFFASLFLSLFSLSPFPPLSPLWHLQLERGIMVEKRGGKRKLFPKKITFISFLLSPFHSLFISFPISSKKIPFLELNFSFFFLHHFIFFNLRKRKKIKERERKNEWIEMKRKQTARDRLVFILIISFFCHRIIIFKRQVFFPFRFLFNSFVMIRKHFTIEKNDKKERKGERSKRKEERMKEKIDGEREQIEWRIQWWKQT